LKRENIERRELLQQPWRDNDDQQKRERRRKILRDEFPFICPYNIFEGLS
jgi:hypothetical protein